MEDGHFTVHHPVLDCFLSKWLMNSEGYHNGPYAGRYPRAVELLVFPILGEYSMRRWRWAGYGRGAVELVRKAKGK